MLVKLVIIHPFIAFIAWKKSFFSLNGIFNIQEYFVIYFVNYTQPVIADKISRAFSLIPNIKVFILNTPA
jgi:hypothetical protein